MGFWIFVLIMVLLIPVTMIVFGRLFSKAAPKEINYMFGYRTKRFVMNDETWRFAYKYIGKLWYICGLIVLPISVVAMAFVFGKGTDIVGTVGGILTAVQMIPLIGSFIPTEKALKRNFDEYGRKI